MSLRRSIRLASKASAAHVVADAAPSPLETLPDDIFRTLLGAHLVDVLVPQHIGRLASTNNALRLLLAEHLAALQDDHTMAKALFAARGVEYEGYQWLAWYRSNLVAAHAPILGRLLCSEATAGFLKIDLGSNTQFGTGGPIAITSAASAGGLRQINLLSLADTGMGVEGMRVLSACLGVGGLPSLETLLIDRNGIGNAGAAFLSEAFAKKKAPAIVSLNLHNNEIDDEGIMALMATAADGKMATLQRLWIHGNPFGDEGSESLADTIVAGFLPEFNQLSVRVEQMDNTKLRTACQATDVLLHVLEERD